jgi:hypothetical protein
MTFRYAFWRGRGCCPFRVRFVPAWWLSVLRGRVPGTLAVIAVLVMGAVAWCRLVRWSGRSGGEAGEGPAAPAPGFRGQALGGAALVFFLPGVPGLQDALVADDEQRRGEQHQRGQAHQAAPAAADVVGGGVLGGGEAAFGAGAAGVGAAVRGGWVVVFLRGLGKAPG